MAQMWAGGEHMGRFWEGENRISYKNKNLQSMAGEVAQQ